MNHILDDFFWGFKAKRGRVANVEFNNATALIFEAFGFFKHWAANVIAHVYQFL